MVRDRADYKYGDKAEYHEAGEAYKVTIIFNFSNDDWLDYRLSIDKVLFTTNKYETKARRGLEFCVQKSKKQDLGIWCLLE